MRNDVIGCQWRVPTGFRWVTAKAAVPPQAPGKASPVLTYDSGPARLYNPLDDYPTLMRTFADLTPDQDAILKFASTYGPLGHTAYTDQAELGPVEKLSDW